MTDVTQFLSQIDKGDIAAAEKPFPQPTDRKIKDHKFSRLRPDVTE